MTTHVCAICSRPLDTPGNPLSVDCGGDCWGCVGQIEAEDGYPPSVEQVRLEILQGWRDAEGKAPPSPDGRQT